MSDMTSTRTGLAALRRPAGGFAMVAVDQREALRGMLEQATGRTADDAAITEFKVHATRVLSPLASGILLDVAWGLRPVLDGGALDPGCGLIVAADELIGPRGAGTEDVRLDTTVDAREMAALGAAALKLLVIWRPDEAAAAREELTAEFLRRARAAGAPGIVEAVVKPPRDPSYAGGFDREDAVIAAAREFGGYAPALYKAEVPLQGRGSHDAIRERARAITDAVPCPWVVLSSGVTADDFPTAVAAACDGGADGFLAGRAIWADCVGADDTPGALHDRAVPRLQRLGGIVDEARASR